MCVCVLAALGVKSGRICVSNCVCVKIETVCVYVFVVGGCGGCPSYLYDCLSICLMV